MATINERKGINKFDRTEKGDVGTGSTLKREGTEKAPFDPGLFAKLIDVSWGTHGTIDGQFFACGSALTSLQYASMVDTDLDDPLATVQFGKRGWISTQGKVFVYAAGSIKECNFFNGLRVKLFGEHALVVAGAWLPGGTDFNALVAVSLDDGVTWTDLRYPTIVNSGSSAIMFNAATGTLWVANHRVLLPTIDPDDDAVLLYKFTPGATPTDAGTWTLVRTDPFDTFAGAPTFGYPPIPSVIPSGSYIGNDGATYYDDGTGGYKYQQVGGAFDEWYNGIMHFIGSDGKDHTLEQKADDGPRLDGELVQVVDDRFSSDIRFSCGNTLLAATASRSSDGQGIVIASADLGETWEVVSSDLSPNWTFSSINFGKNKL